MAASLIYRSYMFFWATGCLFWFLIHSCKWRCSGNRKETEIYSVWRAKCSQSGAHNQTHWYSVQRHGSRLQVLQITQLHILLNIILWCQINAWLNGKTSELIAISLTFVSAGFWWEEQGSWHSSITLSTKNQYLQASLFRE